MDRWRKVTGSSRNLFVLLLLNVLSHLCGAFKDHRSFLLASDNTTIGGHETLARNQALVRAVRESLAEYEIHRQKTQQTRHRRAIKRVCYGELGCFEDTGPFAYLEMLPSPPEEIDTKFHFYSTKSRSERPLIELSFLSMTKAFEGMRNRTRQQKRDVNQSNGTSQSSGREEIAKKKTPVISSSTPRLSSWKRNHLTLDEMEGFDNMSVRIIVHGFGSACSHVWIYEMRTALMAVEDCIVICMDWENGATFPNYVRAATNTRLVGKQLAMLVRNLQEHKGLNLSRTHIIGFSLGAHVSGFAGAELPGLARITGLDPAGPLFEAQHPKVRLDNSDAQFVDVIHSNGENLILGGLGSWQPMGHVDFYPNGGRVQTGCSNLFVGAVTDFIWSAQTAEEEEGRSLCNHRRAYKFFIDSVASRCMFPAFPCANYNDFLHGKCFTCPPEGGRDEELAQAPHCGNMGYYADRSPGRGQLYLLTREEEPFCAHQFQLQIFNSFNDLPLRTIGRLEAILEGEGGLNETFQISEKDDAEFFAGHIVSKIIVPHPALGFPTTLSLNYRHYSGWLSKGLPHWDIDKVVLTDSFGRSNSICRPSTKLISGTPVRLKLKPGSCQLHNQEDYGSLSYAATSTIDSSHLDTEQVTSYQDDAVDNAKTNKNILNLGTNFQLDRNHSIVFQDRNEVPWQPILDGNSLDKEQDRETSRSFQSAVREEIYEPVLNDKRLAVGRGRHLSDYGEGRGPEEIMEPILKATVPGTKRGKVMPATATPTSTTPSSLAAAMKDLSTESMPTKTIRITPIAAGQGKDIGNNSNADVITVQLFPLRLGEILQKAERYARETLFTFINAQAPRFFGFNFGNSNVDQEESKGSEVRVPRYIPRRFETSLEQSTNRPLQDTRGGGDATNSAPKRAMKRVDFISGERSRSNIFNLIRPKRRFSNVESVSSYYTNRMVPSTRQLQPLEPEMATLYVDLPTYRPLRQHFLLPSTTEAPSLLESHQLKSANRLRSTLPPK